MGLTRDVANGDAEGVLPLGTDLFSPWLDYTLETQRRIFDTDPTELRGEALIEYVRWNVLAATRELGELLDCFHWKPWIRSGALVVKDRARALEELSDVLAFLANLGAALGAGADLTQTYIRVRERCHARVLAGDDGHRCRTCGHTDFERDITWGGQPIRSCVRCRTAEEVHPR